MNHQVCSNESRSRCWLIKLFVVVIVAAAACSGPQPSSPISITYAMPITVAAIPAYVALERGFWKEEALDVKAEMFSAGRLALDSLLAGNSQVMSVSETPLMHAILQGNRLYIVGTVTEHQEVKLIARRDHGIQKESDLRGKRVATLPGTNSDYFMHQFLNANGLKADDVKITNMAPPEMVTSLVQGAIDGYFAWEPHIYYARRQLGDKVVVFKPSALYEGRHCVAMNQDFVRSNPGVVEKLIRGFLHAERFINERPDDAMADVAKRTGMDKETLNSLWAEYKVTVELDATLVRILEKEGRWARTQAGSGEPLPNFRNFIYTAALEKERPSAVKLSN